MFTVYVLVIVLSCLFLWVLWIKKLFHQWKSSFSYRERNVVLWFDQMFHARLCVGACPHNPRAEKLRQGIP